MSIDIHIHGDNAGDIIRELGLLTAAFYAGVTRTTAPAEPQTASEVVAVENPVTRRTRKKKESEDVRTDDADARQPVLGDTDGGAAGGDAGAGDGATGTAPTDGTSDGEQTAAGDAQVDAAAVQEPAPADAVVAEPAQKLSYDELRAFVINDYLNPFFKSQEAKQAAFRKLLDDFGIATMKNLEEGKIGEFKAKVDALIAEKKGV